MKTESIKDIVAAMRGGVVPPHRRDEELLRFYADKINTAYERREAAINAILDEMRKKEPDERFATREDRECERRLAMFANRIEQAQMLSEEDYERSQTAANYWRGRCHDAEQARDAAEYIANLLGQEILKLRRAAK